MGPFDVLEISSRATEEEVRKAYRAMAKKWHPDRKLDDQETATKKFKEIDAAYRAILRDRRREARKHSSAASSSSSSSSSKQTTDLHDPPDNHSKTKNTDLDDPLHTDSGNFRVENVDLGHKLPKASGSRPSTAESSESSASSTLTSSRTVSSSSSSSSFSSSSTFVSSKTSADSAKSESSLSKKTPCAPSLIEAREVLGSEHGMPPPSFTFSTSSSEVSAYDNHAEITLPPRASAAAVVHDGTEMNETSEIEPVRMDGSVIAVPALVSSARPKASTRSHGSSSENRKDKMHSSKKRRSSSKDHEERTLVPEFDSALARSVGVSHQWTYTIPLPLTDLFHGKKLRFRVVRCKLSGKRKTVFLDIDVPPGSMHGTQIIFKSAGHEKPDGSRQDIHFIVEEERHEKFKRVGDDLVLDVRLPWSSGLKREKGLVKVTGMLDGSEREFEVDFVGEGNVVGVERIEGGGMPVFGTERRGCLVVRWEIFMPEPLPQTKWGALRHVLRL